MPTSTTECVVPPQFVAAAPAALVRFIAYGEEANFVHPPRRKDPNVVWNQEWAAKVRLKSTAATMLGEEGMGVGGSRSRGGAQSGGGTQQGSGSSTPNPADAMQEGVKALKRADRFLVNEALHHHPTAIYIQHDTIDVSGSVGGEEQHRLRMIFGYCQPAQRHL